MLLSGELSQMHSYPFVPEYADAINKKKESRNPPFYIWLNYNYLAITRAISNTLFE